MFYKINFESLSTSHQFLSAQKVSEKSDIKTDKEFSQYAFLLVIETDESSEKRLTYVDLFHTEQEANEEREKHIFNWSKRKSKFNIPYKNRLNKPYRFLVRKIKIV